MRGKMSEKYPLIKELGLAVTKCLGVDFVSAYDLEALLAKGLNDAVISISEKRKILHAYIIVKLNERDYHAVADAAMDLRELDVAIKQQKLIDSLQDQLDWSIKNETQYKNALLEMGKKSRNEGHKKS